MTIQTSSSQASSSAAAGGRAPSNHAEQRQQHVVVMLQMLMAMLQCLRPLLLLPHWWGGWKHCQVGQLGPCLRLLAVSCYNAQALPALWRSPACQFFAVQLPVHLVQCRQMLAGLSLQRNPQPSTHVHAATHKICVVLHLLLCVARLQSPASSTWRLLLLRGVLRCWCMMLRRSWWSL
jgi:hypothetical protein